MQFRIVIGSLIALAIASNAYARPQGMTGARCSQEDLACPSHVVVNDDRERANAEHPVDLRAWLYNQEASREPPAQRDDASGSPDLMVVHSAGNVVWIRW